MGEREAWLEGAPPAVASSLGAFEAIVATRADAARPRGDRLGELLLGEDLMTGTELKNLLAEQRQTGRRLGELVLEHGYASGPTLVKLLARQCQVELETEDGFGAGLRRALELSNSMRRGRRQVREFD